MRRVSYFYDGDVGNFYYAQGHPMKPYRMRMTHNLLVAYGLIDKMTVHAPPRASERDLSRFHADDYVHFLKSVTPDAAHDHHDALTRFNVLEDCPVFDGLWEHSQIAAGGSLAGAARLNNGESDVAINWAGGLHHAKKAEASGFCYVNDCVLAILELLKVHARVLYVDIDIHHGDGVEEAFFSTDRVMTASFHKFGGFFPGTGHVDDVGTGRGKNYAVNFPLKDGIDDESYREIFLPVMEKIMQWYAPGAIVLQCGADSLTGDRLGCFNLSLRGHAQCVDFLKAYNVPLLLLGGGGYTIRNVARCWAYETSRVVGAELSDSLPFNDNLEFYAPEFRLHIVPSNMENHNTRAELEANKAKIMEQLRSLPCAPSAPFIDTPQGPGPGARFRDMDDSADPDKRPKSNRAKMVHEYEDSDGEECDGSGLLGNLPGSRRRLKRPLYSSGGGGAGDGRLNASSSAPVGSTTPFVSRLPKTTSSNQQAPETTWRNSYSPPRPVAPRTAALEAFPEHVPLKKHRPAGMLIEAKQAPTVSSFDNHSKGLVRGLSVSVGDAGLSTHMPLPPSRQNQRQRWGLSEVHGDGDGDDDDDSGAASLDARLGKAGRLIAKAAGARVHSVEPVASTYGGKGQGSAYKSGSGGNFGRSWEFGKDTQFGGASPSTVGQGSAGFGVVSPRVAERSPARQDELKKGDEMEMEIDEAEGVEGDPRIKGGAGDDSGSGHGRPASDGPVSEDESRRNAANVREGGEVRKRQRGTGTAERHDGLKTFTNEKKNVEDANNRDERERENVNMTDADTSSSSGSEDKKHAERGSKPGESVKLRDEPADCDEKSANSAAADDMHEKTVADVSSGSEPDSKVAKKSESAADVATGSEGDSELDESVDGRAHKSSPGENDRSNGTSQSAVKDAVRPRDEFVLEDASHDRKSGDADPRKASPTPVTVPFHPPSLPRVGLPQLGVGPLVISGIPRMPPGSGGAPPKSPAVLAGSSPSGHTPSVSPAPARKRWTPAGMAAPGIKRPQESPSAGDGSANDGDIRAGPAPLLSAAGGKNIGAQDALLTENRSGESLNRADEKKAKEAVKDPKVRKTSEEAGDVRDARERSKAGAGDDGKRKLKESQKPLASEKALKGSAVVEDSSGTHSQSQKIRACDSGEGRTNAVNKDASRDTAAAEAEKKEKKKKDPHRKTSAPVVSMPKVDVIDGKGAQIVVQESSAASRQRPKESASEKKDDKPVEDKRSVGLVKIHISPAGKATASIEKKVPVKADDNATPQKD